MTNNMDCDNILKYPLRFEKTYVEKVWGGSALYDMFNRKVDSSKKIGESWELSGLREYESRAVNGPLAGKKIDEIINTYKEKVTGSKCFAEHNSSFPLLLKIIDAHDKLSVQVHPGDSYASKNYNSPGKTEIWYVLSAKKNAKIIAGFNRKKKPGDIVNAVMSGSLDKHLKYLPVKTHDIIYIPAGRVHALLDGVVVAEIQQASDLTFRLYDWDRKDKRGAKRRLHIEESLEVLNYEDDKASIIKRNMLPYLMRGYNKIISNEYFSISEYVLKHDNDSCAFDTSIEDSFHVLLVVEGNGKLSYQSTDEEISQGELVFMPAAMGKYRITGRLKLLKVSY